MKNKERNQWKQKHEEKNEEYGLLRHKEYEDMRKMM